MEYPVISYMGHWSTHISHLFPEILESLFLCLPYPDLCRCMRVCQLWYNILTHPCFLRTYALQHFDLRQGELVSGETLVVWRDSFVYYLQEDDEAEKYVFKPFPMRARCGVHVPYDLNLQRHMTLNPRLFLRALYQLNVLKRMCDATQVCCSGSRTQFQMSAILFMDEDVGADLSLLPDAMLSRFGAHRYLRYTIDMERVQQRLRFDDDDVYLTFGVNGNTLGPDVDDERKQKLLDLGHHLETMFTPSIAFYAGKCDHDNIIDPFLRVHVTRFSQTLFGGIISGVQ